MAAPSRRQYQIYIERPVEVVFAFHADLANYSRIAPDEPFEELVAGGVTALDQDVRAAFRVRQGALWRNMVRKVTLWTPPDSFTEEQVEGPYARWVHQHRFTPFQNGTLMADILEYEVGPLGALTERMGLGKRIDEHFRHRQSAAKGLLERLGRIKGPGA